MKKRIAIYLSIGGQILAILVIIIFGLLDRRIPEWVMQLYFVCMMSSLIIAWYQVIKNRKDKM